MGHQYYSIGTRFINDLNDEGLEESEQYILTQEAIEQGKHYYKFSDSVYREKKMVENFTREFDKLEGESIMGIYGSAHTGLESMNHTNEVPSMANQLKEFYEGNIYSEDLSHISKEMEPLKVETVEVDGKEYKASYFGKEDMTGFKDLTYREFWRLEDAYKDMKDKVKTGDLLPDNNYPMKIEMGQVFMISYGKTDGSIITAYYRSDGAEWKSMLATEEVTLE